MPIHCSIRDVALAAGVSKSTAQRALANDIRCNRETRRRVQDIAAKLGYHPDPLFAAMGTRRKQRSANGVALAYLEAASPGHPGGPYLGHARQRAEQLGYRMEVVDLARWTTPRRLWRVLYARGFAGVLVGSVRTDRHAMLQGNDLFPVVCAGRIDSLPYNTVRPAIVSGMRTALTRMRLLGYRRIGCALMRHTPPVTDDSERFAALLACEDEMIPAKDRIPPLRADIEDRDAFLRWLRKHRPEAVLGFHAGMLDIMRAAGYRVPGDIGFASLHLRILENSAASSGIAGLDQDYRLVARSAVNLLDQMIRHGETGTPDRAITIEVESSWSDGLTLPRLDRRRDAS